MLPFVSRRTANDKHGMYCPRSKGREKPGKEKIEFTSEILSVDILD